MELIKCNVTTQDFLNQLNTMERKALKTIALEVGVEYFGFDLSPLLHYVERGEDYAMINCQDKSLELESGVTINSFAITINSEPIVVCFDEEDEYVFYRVEKF